MQTFSKVIAAFAAILILTVAVYSVGVLVGEQRAEYRQYDEQRKLLESILATDPAFGNLKVSPTNDGGWVMLDGMVERGEKWVKLREAVIRALGERRGENALAYVTVDGVNDIPAPVRP